MTRNKLALLVAAIFGATLLSACDRPQTQADAAKERSGPGMTADSSSQSKSPMGAPSQPGSATSPATPSGPTPATPPAAEKEDPAKK